MKITFTKGNETKNKVRYEEEGDEVAVGTLYVGKDHVKEMGDPDRIEVSIEAA